MLRRCLKKLWVSKPQMKLSDCVLCVNSPKRLNPGTSLAHRLNRWPRVAKCRVLDLTSDPDVCLLHTLALIAIFKKGKTIYMYWVTVSCTFIFHSDQNKFDPVWQIKPVYNVEELLNHCCDAFSHCVCNQLIWWLLFLSELVFYLWFSKMIKQFVFTALQWSESGTTTQLI